MDYTRWPPSDFLQYQQQQAQQQQNEAPHTVFALARRNNRNQRYYLQQRHAIQHAAVAPVSYIAPYPPHPQYVQSPYGFERTVTLPASPPTPQEHGSGFNARDVPAPYFYSYSPGAYPAASIVMRSMSSSPLAEETYCDPKHLLHYSGPRSGELEGKEHSSPHSEAFHILPTLEIGADDKDFTEDDQAHNDSEDECRPERRVVRRRISDDKARRAKEFACDLCDKSFRRQEHLKRHVRSLHTKEKPFTCVECHKNFSRSDNLSQHMRVHAKATTFASSADRRRRRRARNH